MNFEKKPPIEHFYCNSALQVEHKPSQMHCSIAEVSILVWAEERAIGFLDAQCVQVSLEDIRALGLDIFDLIRT